VFLLYLDWDTTELTSKDTVRRSLHPACADSLIAGKANVKVGKVRTSEHDSYEGNDFQVAP
jgi:hypothetical protein